MDHRNNGGLSIVSRKLLDEKTVRSHFHFPSGENGRKTRYYDCELWRDIVHRTFSEGDNVIDYILSKNWYLEVSYLTVCIRNGLAVDVAGLGALAAHDQVQHIGL